MCWIDRLTRAENAQESSKKQKEVKELPSGKTLKKHLNVVFCGVCVCVCVCVCVHVCFVCITFVSVAQHRYLVCRPCNMCIGHVDAGKSTISGHIMYLTGQVCNKTFAVKSTH